MPDTTRKTIPEVSATRTLTSADNCRRIPATVSKLGKHRRDCDVDRYRHPLIFALLIYLCSVPLNALQSPEFSKVAVVLGNQFYTIGPLKTPNKDAAQIRELLRSYGFAALPETGNAFATVKDFEDILQQIDGLSSTEDLVFYYAGHGVGIDGVAYLVPTKAPANPQPGDLIPVNKLLERLRKSRVRHIFVIIDACSAGLAVSSDTPTNPNAAVSSLILLTSATAGAEAYDGTGDVSTFTALLRKSLKENSCDLQFSGMCTSTDIANSLQLEVLRSTQGAQIPALQRFPGNSDDEMQFQLNGREVEKWRALKKQCDPDNPASDRGCTPKVLRDFIGAFPSGVYVDRAKKDLYETEANLLCNGKLETRNVADFPDPGDCDRLPAGTPVRNLVDDLLYRWIPPKSTNGKVSDGFWIGEIEVPVRAYAVFRGGSISVRAPGFYPGGWERYLDPKCDFPGGDSSPQEENCDVPVVNVSWQEAADYCTYAGNGSYGRLPSGDEWERVRTGNAQGDYPFGPDKKNGREVTNVPLDADLLLANVANGWSGGREIGPRRPPSPSPLRSRSFPAGYFGIFDMIGNVAEWTRDKDARGGSFADTWKHLKRPWKIELGEDNRIGFRCVIEPRPPAKSEGQ
jgi:Sulfatase-modifying factor enzyme 1/Caspase domain